MVSTMILVVVLADFARMGSLFIHYVCTQNRLFTKWEMKRLMNMSRLLLLIRTPEMLLETMKTVGCRSEKHRANVTVLFHTHFQEERP